MANSLTMGLPRELGLTGQQPNAALAVFFVPYILLEVPSNVALRRVTPRVWLSLCILGFGVVMLGQGFVHNYGGLLATRFLLGAFEAGIFPGSFYLISFWYRRREAQKRFTLYFCSVIVASAFGGLLASAIARMDGVGGLSSWRWVFILEGILTMGVAVVAFFCVSDFPDGAAWLTPRERHHVLCKTGRAQLPAACDDDGKITGRDLRAFFGHTKHHAAALLYFCKQARRQAGSKHGAWADGLVQAS